MPIVTSTDPTQHRMLDPCLLGRPVHLLPQFARRLGEDLSGAMQAPGARRYWGPFQLDAIDLVPASHPAPARWVGSATGHGAVAVAFERALLLGLLDCRYGRRGAPPMAARDPGTERITATEERLAVTLAAQLAAVLAARVGANLAAPGTPAPNKAAALAAPLPVSAPAPTAWTVQATLREPQSGSCAQLWMALDAALMADILRGLKPDQPRRLAAPPAEPLAARLQVKLEGRLVSQEITLAHLFDMQVGDVIPVAVGRAEVMLDGSRLFTAAVAEHKGKLCLTTFEDAD